MGVKNNLLPRHSRPDRTIPTANDQLSRDGVFSRDNQEDGVALTMSEPPFQLEVDPGMAGRAAP
jgi:hypothetical protein